MKTFKRGIHPPDSKIAADRPIDYILPKHGAVLVYPMVQHIGVACTPLVKKGEYVKVGQVIADSDAFLSSPIHSSVSGTVKDIKISLTPGGKYVDCIFIENDGLLTETDGLNIPTDYKSLPRDEIIKKIRQAGIVGLGGAGFPTHIKLNPPKDKPISHIFINAAECEPFLTTDHRVLLEETERIFIGIDVLLCLFPKAQAIVAIEDNKPDAIKRLIDMNPQPDKIKVQPLQTKYPQGAEKQLITACLGKEVPSGGLPHDIGCLVQNVDTVIAMHRAFIRGRPLMRKVVTITGGAIKNPGNYKIRLGMTYKDAVEMTGGFKEEPYKLVMGGPMMGVAVHDLNVPVVKTSSALIAFTKKDGELPPERNCIRCGRCVDHCPIGLLPMELNRFVLHDEFDDFKKYYGMDCIECGSCSYICPSKRYLAQSIRTCRRYLMQKKLT